MPLVVQSTSAKNATSEIYTSALLEYAWHIKKKIIDFSMLLEGDVIRCVLDFFNHCDKCLINKNVSMNEKKLR